MSDTDAVRAHWDAQLQAMDEGDTTALGELFADDATLTHMTGDVQPREEWFAGMRRRDFVYHRVVDEGVAIDVDGDTARLVGRIVTGVTDDGSGHAWPLRVEQDLVRRDGEWFCTSSRVTLR